MNFDVISIVIGLVLGAAAVFLIMRGRIAILHERLRHQEEAKQAMSDTFSTMAQEALSKSQESFLALAQEKLKQAQADGSHDLEKRQKAITDMVDPVKKNLEKLGTALEQVQGTDKALREDLQLLNRETAKLVGALKDPAGQGLWGEFILEGVLDKSGLIKGVHYETQVTLENEGSRQRPDAIINLQEGLHIVVDSKAPLSEFADKLAEDLSADEIDRLTTAMAKQVREHVKTLGKKGYWEGIDSPDFTVMFLPSEHLFSMALRADPTLVDFASSQNVIMASPTLLMSLLRVVHLSWRQAELAQNAKDISAAGAELYGRLATFTGNFERVGKGLLSALGGYNDAIGSLERSVLPSARKLKELHVETAGKEIENPAPLEKSPRDVSATELLESDEEKKRA